MVRVIGCFRMPSRGGKVMPSSSGEGIFTIPMDNNMSSTSTLDIAEVSYVQQMQQGNNVFDD